MRSGAGVSAMPMAWPVLRLSAPPIYGPRGVDGAAAGNQMAASVLGPRAGTAKPTPSHSQGPDVLCAELRTRA